MLTWDKLRDNSETEVSQDITSSATTLYVVNVNLLPAAPFYGFIFDANNQAATEEVIYVSAKGSNYLTIERGKINTTGITHSKNEIVSELFNAVTHQKAYDYIDQSVKTDADVEFNSTTTGLLHAGGATNFTSTETDGTVVFNGDAVVWDDIRVPTSATHRGGSKDPGFALWLKDAAGTSQGIFVEWFDKTSEEELYFTMQVPHSYKYGTDLEAHLHWIPKSSQTNQTVSWGLEYSFQKIGSVFAPTTIIYGNTTIPVAASPVANTHYLTELGTIDGSSIDEVSSMLSGRVFRDATGAGKTDNYNDDAGLIEIDFHFIKDTVGSRTEYVK